MKNKLIIVLAIWLFSSSCSTNSQELSREEAMSLIIQHAEYPKVIDYEIYCGDPEFAKKVLDAGLEAQGLVTVQQTQKISEMGSPLIQFLEKAQPYLMSTPEEDKSINVQKVKLADEEVQEVTGIKMMDDNKSAIAEYTTSYINITPFSALVNRDFKEKDKHTARFSLYDDGWRVEK